MRSLPEKLLLLLFGGTMCVAGENQLTSSVPALLQSNLPALKETGYRGIWFTLGQKCAYGDKYSVGLGTYTANHVPMAIYCKQVNKTFFVYGGAKHGQRLRNYLNGICGGGV